MKDTRTFAFFVMLVFVFSLAVPALAAENNQAGKLQPQAAKQAPQVMKPIPTVKMTPPAAPKSPNVTPAPPQSGPSQKDMLLKQAEERKRQEKAREKMLKDARTVQVAPSKGKAATAGKNAQGNSLNRTASDLGR
jgi:type IV secretory pathway VirB10-like protein